MKVIVVFLLFVSATAAINEWVGLPEGKFEQLDQLLDDEPFLVRRIGSPSAADLTSLLESAEVNDHGEEENEGSGVNPGPDSAKEAVKDIVDSLHAILPAIKILKKARDEQNHEYSISFVQALKHAKDDDEVKEVLGGHMMELHQRCIAIKLAFARHAHATGLFDLINNDVLDLTVVMGHVIAAADKQYFDIFEVFAHLVHLNKLHNHPGIQAIMTIGQMVADAACELKMDGLFGKIKEIIDNEDKEGDFDIKDKITPFIYLKKSKICPGDLIKLLQPHQRLSIKARLLNIVFDHCKEVRYVRFAASTVIDGIKLSKKVEAMKKLEMKRLNDMIKEVSDHMESKEIEEARITVANYVLANLRRAIVVGFAVHKELNSSHPNPPHPNDDSAKPSGGRPKPGSGGHKPGGAASKPTSGSPKPSGGSSEPGGRPSKPFGGSPKPSPSPKKSKLKKSANLIEDESINLY